MSDAGVTSKPDARVMTGEELTSGTLSTTVDLSVIVPAYDESKRIGPGLATILDYLRATERSRSTPWVWELLIVNDGSRDDTEAVARSAIASEPRARLISYQPNRGKGYAVRTGVLESRGQWVVFLDADLSTPVQEIDNALRYLESGEDLVIGSRAHPQAQIEQPPSLFRRLATVVFALAKHVLVGLERFSDTQCGFKAYRGETIRPLFKRSVVDRFMFDVEILYLAERAGLRIREMPVRWSNAAGSKVRFFEGVYNMVKDLVRIRWVHRGFPGGTLKFNRPPQERQ